MKDKPRVKERRNSFRVKMVFPALYTRFDNQKRAWEQKPSKSVDVSAGGVKLKSGFPVDSGEFLEISMALGDNLVTFRANVVYATPSEDEGFELGISIEEIENEDRIALTRFIIQKWQREGI